VFKNAKNDLLQLSRLPAQVKATFAFCFVKFVLLHVFTDVYKSTFSDQCMFHVLLLLNIGHGFTLAFIAMLAAGHYVFTAVV